MKILAENYSASRCSVTIMHNVDGKDVRFKLWYRNGNSYYEGGIDIQTLNLDYKTIYSSSDVPNLDFGAHYWSNDSARIIAGKEAINTLMEFVEQVF